MKLHLTVRSALVMAGVVSVRKADYEDIAEIEAPDAKTVVFKLSKASVSRTLQTGSASASLISWTLDSLGEDL